MKKRTFYTVLMVTGALLMTTACAQKSTEAKEPESTVETTAASRSVETSLKDLSAMLGKNDADAKGLLGGGTENKTEDGTILIGRDYKAILFGQDVQIHTMYDEEEKINSVQAELQDAKAKEYQKEMEKELGVTAVQTHAGESGQNAGQWSYDGKLINLYRYEDTALIELFIPME